MTTRSIERTPERRGLRLEWILVIGIGIGLTVIALVLAVNSAGHVDNRDLARLSPAASPVPSAPTTDQRLYSAATPAAPNLAVTKLQPEWVAVPTPPVSEAAVPSGADRSENTEGSALVVPGGLIGLIIAAFLAWIWLRLGAKFGFMHRSRRGDSSVIDSRNSRSQMSSNFN